MTSVIWDKWEVVNDTINEKGQGQFPLVVVLWAQTWNPPALNAAESLEEIRSSDGVASTAQVFIIDKDQCPQKALEYEITTCPSLLMFWKGDLITVRRCFQADANKYVGSVSKETWLQILEEGKAAGEKYDKGDTFLRACFDH
mmetsp:Transcript_24722/g.34077  ORF Transcript_24722/g.34077 Transcript_24722/m.34077 type:complete len:143 (+) Transcript_24722:131-559(+)|eukprot:CAMPEP_0196571430 /NCGR_PEP_ID=MMETSP1081-20130531/1624_1 /TAXON_ID=36882 /ORGANISM="Pyramimonas amylifera, Strain CCMP720" /LENGTH=142 /DNA_ID=CAMNT_0041888389 /DNA_START=125 /DNA_END=553 /DNA_ORIENTATION=+